MKIYYAHCISIYNTPQETRDLETLRHLGLEPINPNEPAHAEGYAHCGMDYFLKFVGLCDAIIFRALPSGHIPAGVAKEIEAFKAAGKPVLELPSMISTRLLSVETTREYLAEVGQR